MYVDDKDGKGTTLKCNAPGCKKSFKGANHGDAWRKAHAAGWSTPNAATALCTDHKPARAKKEANGKGKKTAPKGKAPAKGKKGVADKRGRVWTLPTKGEATVEKTN